MQDKRNFQGGLNRDDDSRVLPNGDYFYAQNIRVASSEDRNTMLLENIRGMVKEETPDLYPRKELDYKVIGSYEDSPRECLYYFLYNKQNFHAILEYNINTDIVTTVFRDSGHADNNVLRFDENTLITGINKIDDILYWTSDNTFEDGIQTKNNEPKYINVEMAKAGWAVYYDSGAFSVNPQTAFNLETMYPYELYTSSSDNNGNNPDVPYQDKQKYLDVCKTRPLAPIYFHQTPIRNISSSVQNTNTLTMADGTTCPADSIAAGGISYVNAGIESVQDHANFEFAQKKNNLFGWVWQFAYRYIYKNNETSAYSEWSYVLPAPQYFTNRVDEGKQNAYNQIRVWYLNGPSDVEKIEIVARKCSYIETSPDEGNKGEYYLIATVDNNYYDPTFAVAADGSDLTSIVVDSNGSSVANTQYGWNDVSTLNIPYIQQMLSNGTNVVRSPLPAAYIDFRNDGVYSQVDPVAFNKLYDMVPKRAKAQEIANENRIVYGNYVDGFDQVNPHYHLSPVCITDGSAIANIVDNVLSYVEMESGSWDGDGDNQALEGDGTDMPESTSGWRGTSSNFLYGTIGDTAMHEADATPYAYPSGNADSFGATDTFMDGADGLESSFYSKRILGYDVHGVRSIVKITFPTIVESGQAFRLKLQHRERYKSYLKNDNNIKVRYPFQNYDTGQDESKNFSYFGFQIDLTKTIGSGGVGGLVDEFIEDIKLMANFAQDSGGGGIDDDRGTNQEFYDNGEPHEFYNPQHADGPNPGKVYTTWMKTQGTSTHTYKWDGTQRQGAAVMRLAKIYKEDTSYGAANAIFMEWVPYGQVVSGTDGDGNNNEKPDVDCSGKVKMWSDFRYPFNGVPNYHAHSGGSTSNIHCWINVGGDGDEGDYADPGMCSGDGCTGFHAVDASGSKFGCSTLGGALGRRYNADYAEIEYASTNSWDGAKGPVNLDVDNWESQTNVNVDGSSNISLANDKSGFKSGAWHRFGLVYYDEKGRSSTVMLNTQDSSDTTYDRNSSCYVDFPTEKKYALGPISGVFNPANPSEIQATELNDAEKLNPSMIYWKIFHKPPIWAQYYHWVYARNTSIGKYMQYIVDNCYVNTGAKAGTTPAEAEADTKLYISLNTMDGRDWSYSERDKSLVGDWSFAEGDRVRLITKGANFANVLWEKYYDLKISDVGHFPGRFELASDDTTTKVKDSPVGQGVEGKFIIVNDPNIADFDKSQANSNGMIPNWHKVIVEIYRPKKNTNEEHTLYFEFGEKFPIGNPGEDGRFHEGDIANQGNVYDANNKTLNTPAEGIFRRGDVWHKRRKFNAVDGDGNFIMLGEQGYESYFLNDFMQTNHCSIARPHIFSTYAKEQRRSATLTYSDVYQPDTQYNGLHSFSFSQRPYMDYDLSLGSIQKLVARDTNLVLMQENKISSVLVNKAIITSPSGDEGISLSNNVLPETATPFGGDFGVCLNPESVAVQEESIYFTDIRRGAVLRLGGNGLTAISDYKMKDFFRDKMDQYQNILESEYYDRLGGGLFIIGGYDRRHGEYVVTFPGIYSIEKSATNKSKLAFFNQNAKNFNEDTVVFEQRKSSSGKTDAIRDDDKLIPELEVNGREFVLTNPPETIAFHEGSNRWSTFYTFYPEYYGTLNRIFISFKDGTLYKHDSDVSSHNTFYEKPLPDESKIAVPFNTDVSTVKTFTAISVEGPSVKESTPIITTASDGSPATVTATTGSANLEGSNVNFNNNDIEIGDSIWYRDNGVYRTLGVITAITDADTLVTSVGEVNAFITASSTSSGDALENVFVITSTTTAYHANFETNINSTFAPHRLSYWNDEATNNNPGSWVEREQVVGTDIPMGITNTAGGEYFGVGHISSDSGNEEIFGSTTWAALVDGVVQGTTTNTAFTLAGIIPGDILYYDNAGVETVLGTVASIQEDRMITLSGNASASLANIFVYTRKNAGAEGDRLKGHYMDTTLTKRSKDKINMFAVNAQLINSELSNK